jgi:hypothetical protein
MSEALKIAQVAAGTSPVVPSNDIHIEVTVEIVEIEIYGRENRPPPPAKAYKVRIDREHYVFETRHVTGQELLIKASKVPPEKYEIEKRVHGGQYVPVPLDQKVDLGEPGIEVFETFPLDETEG